MRLSQMRTLDQVVEEHREADPTFREEWDRGAFARGVALAVVGYRSRHGLSQRQLAAATGITQPAIARLEAGERNPLLGTLAKLTGGTGISFHIDITDGDVKLTPGPTG